MMIMVVAVRMTVVMMSMSRPRLTAVFLISMIVLGMRGMSVLVSVF